jgi:hypothetical protein
MHKMARGRSCLIFGSLALCLPACGTVTALRSTTIAQSGSATDIVNSMILDNVARALMETCPLPWHVQITQGSIGITDSATPTANYTWASPVSRMLELTGTRSWAVSWTIVPELDHQKLNDLRDLYFAYTHQIDDQRPPVGCDATPAKLSPIFLTGSSLPAGVIYGQYHKTYVWVNPSKAKEFGEFVIQVLIKAPVDATQRAIQLPGVQR